MSTSIHLSFQKRKKTRQIYGITLKHTRLLCVVVIQRLLLATQTSKDDEPIIIVIENQRATTTPQMTLVWLGGCALRVIVQPLHPTKVVVLVVASLPFKNDNWNEPWRKKHELPETRKMLLVQPLHPTKVTLVVVVASFPFKHDYWNEPWRKKLELPETRKRKIHLLLPPPPLYHPLGQLLTAVSTALLAWHMHP